jgi:MoaA/NifB/PqqE/SkfB family radical SAM enzyme
MSENANFITAPLSTPTVVNLEITSGCNHRCRYCYNYWRKEPVEGIKINKLTAGQLDQIIQKIVDAQVFNVIFSGGEPFLNFEIMQRGIKELTDAGIKTTCNSNLTLATYDHLEKLKQAGLPHILTSISCYKPEINDFIFGRKGSFDDVTRNIKYAVKLGIRVSVNNVINRYNYRHAYRTGMLANELGASNYFVTRAGINKKENPHGGEIVILEPDKYLEVLDNAVKVKEETGINIYSLYQYPLCLLKDPKKYNGYW